MGANLRVGAIVFKISILDVKCCNDLLDKPLGISVIDDIFRSRRFDVFKQHPRVIGETTAPEQYPADFAALQCS